MHILFAWRQAVNLNKIYKLNYPNQYYLCIYENLIRNPEKELIKIFNFLEIDWDPKFMNITFQNSTLRSKQYKNGYDIEAVNRWKYQLSKNLNKIFVLLCKNDLAKLGYHF
jgi:hypothetical protein